MQIRPISPAFAHDAQTGSALPFPGSSLCATPAVGGICLNAVFALDGVTQETASSRHII